MIICKMKEIHPCITKQWLRTQILSCTRLAALKKTARVQPCSIRSGIFCMSIEASSGVMFICTGNMNKIHPCISMQLPWTLILSVYLMVYSSFGYTLGCISVSYKGCILEYSSVFPVYFGVFCFKWCNTWLYLCVFWYILLVYSSFYYSFWCISVVY